MRDFSVSCTRKQGQEGVMVHNYCGVMYCLTNVGTRVLLALPQIRLLATE